MLKEGIFFFVKGQRRHFNCPCNTNAIIRLVGFPCQLPLPPDIAQLIGFCSISFVTLKDKIFLTEIAIQISLLASLVKHLPHQPIQISFSSGSVVPNMRLTKKLFYQGKQTRLLSTKLSWCPIKTNQTRLSSTSEFGLSCSLSTNPTVIFGCLVCLVCYQPISPNYHHCFQKR